MRSRRQGLLSQSTQNRNISLVPTGGNKKAKPPTFLPQSKHGWSPGSKLILENCFQCNRGFSYFCICLSVFSVCWCLNTAVEDRQFLAGELRAREGKSLQDTRKMLSCEKRVAT